MRKQLYLFLFIISLAQVTTGCSDNENMQEDVLGVDVNFTNIQLENGLNGLVEDQKVIVIYRDSASLANTSGLIGADFREIETDFESKLVVLVTMGIQPSSGFDIKIESVLDLGRYLELNILLTVPGVGCVEDDVLTYPYQLFEIDSRKEVVIHERYEARICVT